MIRMFIKSIKAVYAKFRQFFKYCVVGTISTIIDLGFLYIFVEYADIAVIPAATLSFLMAVANGFTFNKFWTFSSKSRNYRKQFVKFLLVALVGLCLNTAFMYLFVEILFIWYMFAKAMTSLIVLIWNFLGNKYWTFRFFERVLHIPSEFEYDISIIIPAYDEERRIAGTLAAVSGYLKQKGLKAEVLVVDDGSTDKTCDVVRGFGARGCVLIESGKNFGKGHAVRLGVERARGEYILFIDADNSTPIEELDKFLGIIEEGYDVVIGSRYLKGSDVQIRQSKMRVLIGRAGNLLIRTFLINDIKDTQCGFKLFTHKAAKEIFSRQKVHRFGFDMEALVIANSLGYKIKEVPVSWFNSSESRVRPIKDSLRTLRDLFYVKLNLWSGRYSSDD